jgi:hypothetical protein
LLRGKHWKPVVLARIFHFGGRSGGLVVRKAAGLLGPHWGVLCVSVNQDQMGSWQKIVDETPWW